MTLRYDTTGQGRLGRDEVERFIRDYRGGVAAPSGSFGYATPAYPSAFPTATAVPVASWDVPRVPGPSAGMYGTTAARAGPPGSSFDAGRLFERFDSNKSGALERPEFERMVTEIRARGINTGPSATNAAPAAQKWTGKSGHGVPQKCIRRLTPVWLKCSSHGCD